MKRAIILVLDSLGIGASDDAGNYGDVGTDTLGHIAKACSEGLADSSERSGLLTLPNLTKLGLGHAAKGSTGIIPKGLEVSQNSIEAAYGYAVEISKGKDTPSGHWEMAGLPVTFDWGYFPKNEPCFPEQLINDLVSEARLPGILGNKHASGTEIVSELGEEHIRSGKPICYTSVDSVFQIAAHEQYFGLERLYQVCEIAKQLTLPLEIGRVIARPFIGDKAEDFRRTGNRHDYTTLPHADTLLDRVCAVGGEVISIGKIADIFANKGISKSIKASGNMALFDATLEAIKTAEDNALIFVNFVDFDSLYGHRRDSAGYARALEAFDNRLPELNSQLQEGDLVLITADHGCDPSWVGTDHTREHVPVLFYGPNICKKYLGRRESFADMGQTIARHLGLNPLDYGVACL